VTIRLDDPVTRERLKRSQLEWGVIMNIAHGYPPNPFPPANMTLEFHGRHQRVKDDIDLGISLEDSRLQDQRRHIMEKFKRLPPGLTVPKQAKALADDRSIGLSASTLLQMIRGDYPPWVARGWAGLKEQQRR
jgi:hypothetical protein